jgi:hypothetical protein
VVRSVLRHKETQVIIANLIVGNLAFYLLLEQGNRVVPQLHASMSVTAIVLLLLAFKVLKKYPGVISQAICALVVSFLVPIIGSAALNLILGQLAGIVLITYFKWLMVFMTVFNAILFRWLEKGRFPEE